MNIEEVLDSVPKYKEFMTVRELDTSSRELADEFSGVSLRRIGESREGRPISCLKIGEGERSALLFAFPHPNEPIGSMTVEFFSRYLAENPDMTKQTGFTWYLIKAIDPDGAALNEGWFKGEFDPVKYARNYYRPPGHEQMEWTFPVKHKNLSFNEPPSETLALMSLIDEIKPDFMFSLHNAGFCGVYFYLTHKIEKSYPHLVDLVRNQNLPLHQGEPEAPYIKELSPGIYEMFGVQEMYDFYEVNGVENPQELIKWGTSSADYLKTVTNNRGFTLLCEMPYFYDTALDDSSLTDEDRRALVFESLEFQVELYQFSKKKFDSIREYCNPNSKIFSSIADMADNFEDRILPEFIHTRNSPMYEGKATVAQAFDSRISSRYYGYLRSAMITRLCDEAIAIHPEKEKELTDIKLEMDEYIESGVRNTLDSTNFEVIPIQKLVRVQVGSALNCIKYLPS